jgi:hypothetical protein
MVNQPNGVDESPRTALAWVRVITVNAIVTI